jgi:hypothetical protein
MRNFCFEAFLRAFVLLSLAAIITFGVDSYLRFQKNRDSGLPACETVTVVETLDPLSLRHRHDWRKLSVLIIDHDLCSLKRSTFVTVVSRTTRDSLMEGQRVLVAYTMPHQVNSVYIADVITEERIPFQSKCTINTGVSDSNEPFDITSTCDCFCPITDGIVYPTVFHNDSAHYYPPENECEIDRSTWSFIFYPDEKVQFYRNPSDVKRIDDINRAIFLASFFSVCILLFAIAEFTRCKRRNRRRDYRPFDDELSPTVSPLPIQVSVLQTFPPPTPPKNSDDKELDRKVENFWKESRAISVE